MPAFKSCWFCHWSVSISRFSLAIRLSVGGACADAAVFYKDLDDLIVHATRIETFSISRTFSAV